MPLLTGHRVEVLLTVDSTNSEARRRVLAAAAGPGSILLAIDQTAGRGRRGHSWHCVPGRSLITTMVVAQPELPRLSRITLLAAVAACRALEAVGSPAISIKWPNDLMRGQRKIAGILVEQLRSPSGEPLLLIGVGINLSLRPGDLPPELEQLATDAGLDERPDTRNSVLGELVQELDQSLAQLGSPGDQARGREYCSRSWLDRRTVVLEYKGQRQTVEIASLTPSGDLLLRDGRELTGEYVQLISVGSGV